MQELGCCLDFIILFFKIFFVTYSVAEMLTSIQLYSIPYEEDSYTRVDEVLTSYVDSQVG